MNKPELVQAIANDTGLSKKDAEAALNSFIANTTKTLKKKDKVALVGFGTFSTTKHKARMGVNPQTGQSLKIPARTVPVFKAGKTLREKVDKK